MKKILLMFIIASSFATAIYASFPVANENVNEISTIVEQASNSTAPVSEDVDWALAIVCFFVGGLGIHQFMLGNTGKGILYLFTFGLCGIGVLIDFINICMGKMSR